LSLTANYNYTSRKNSLGFGLVSNLGPVQLYLTTDNILFPVFLNQYSFENDKGEMKTLKLPSNTKYMNFHFGLNFIFGYKNKTVELPE